MIALIARGPFHNPTQENDSWSPCVALSLSLCIIDDIFDAPHMLRDVPSFIKDKGLKLTIHINSVKAPKPYR
jgi:hypothetical protein